LGEDAESVARERTPIAEDDDPLHGDSSRAFALQAEGLDVSSRGSERGRRGDRATPPERSPPECAPRRGARSARDRDVRYVDPFGVEIDCAMWSGGGARGLASPPAKKVHAYGVGSTDWAKTPNRWHGENGASRVDPGSTGTRELKLAAQEGKDDTVSA
jgi:hypothetical protein